MRHMGIEPRDGSFLFSPIPRRALKGRHLAKNVQARQQTLKELAAAAAREYDRAEITRQVRDLIQRYNAVMKRRVPIDDQLVQEVRDILITPLTEPEMRVIERQVVAGKAVPLI